MGKSLYLPSFIFLAISFCHYFCPIVGKLNCVLSPQYTCLPQCLDVVPTSKSLVTHLITSSHQYPFQALLILQAQCKNHDAFHLSLSQNVLAFFWTLASFLSDLLIVATLPFPLCYKLLRLWIIHFHTWNFCIMYLIPRCVLRIRDTKLNQV